MSPPNTLAGFGSRRRPRLPVSGLISDAAKGLPKPSHTPWVYLPLWPCPEGEKGRTGCCRHECQEIDQGPLYHALDTPTRPDSSRVPLFRRCSWMGSFDAVLSSL